jgi:tRNA(Ile)-lysidine synthase
VTQSSLKEYFLNRLDELTRRACPDVPECGVLVALSGGPDSVALLLGAKNWADQRGRPLAACHLNHQLRGSEADADTRFCQDLCDNLGVQLFVHEEDPRPLARSRGAGLEEAARSLRHDFFRKILAENEHLHCVATGHHQDDQAETVIMRLFRGTGPDGMAGIRPVAGQVIHPLLDVTRSRILAWLEEMEQPWRTDATNLEGDNTRSRLRRELLPLVRSIFGEGADHTPARLAELWEADLDFLEQSSGKVFDALAQEKNGHPCLPVDQLLELHPALAARTLRRWLTGPNGMDPARLESVHLMNIQAWLREGTSGTAVDLPGGCRLQRDFNHLLMIHSADEAPPMRNAGDYRILVARCTLPEDTASFGRSEGFGSLCGPETWNLTCPSSVLKGNLKVRNWKKGDRICPFGLDGSRKLSDLFGQRRISAADRPSVLVVEDDEGIIWVVGLARAERTRLLQPDQPAVTITVARRGNNIQINDTKTDNPLI